MAVIAVFMYFIGYTIGYNKCEDDITRNNK